MKQLKNIAWVAVLTLLVVVQEAQAAPSEITYEKWNDVLERNVNRNGMVDYEALKDDEAFQQVIDMLSKVHPDETWSRNEKMAYWINVYNAFTIKLIIDHWPVASINDIKEPWDQQFINLKGKRYSLNQIEHEILRPQFNDPRVHFAINCASYSCPLLSEEAITPEQLDQQLERFTKNFINDPRRNTVAPGKLEVSKIFEWFAEDFEASGGVRNFISKYSNTDIADSVPVRYKDYDWSLNAEKKK